MVSFLPTHCSSIDKFNFNTQLCRNNNTKDCTNVILFIAMIHLINIIYAIYSNNLWPTVCTHQLVRRSTIQKYIIVRRT